MRKAPANIQDLPLDLPGYLPGTAICGLGILEEKEKEPGAPLTRMCDSPSTEWARLQGSTGPDDITYGTCIYQDLHTAVVTHY